MIDKKEQKLLLAAGIGILALRSVAVPDVDRDGTADTMTDKTLVFVAAMLLAFWVL